MMDGELFIDVVLWAVYIALGVGLVAAVWSAVHGVRTHEQTADALASRRTSMIGYATAATVAVVMVVTYLLASTRPVVSNGRLFTDTWWLRCTDMLLFTSILLICVCSVIVVVAKFRR